jgi:hypothetical protein
MIRMMVIEKDKILPDSHTEGTSLSPSDPVRFVWDKTTKQSVHNSRMKTRVLEDIKENQRLYKHVNSKEFSKKVLDTAFEQCFTTFRAKFKAQRDRLIAEHLKKREDGKARKARHLSRRKIVCISISFLVSQGYSPMLNNCVDTETHQSFREPKQDTNV